MDATPGTRLPQLRWEQFSVPWTAEELIVVWSAAPKDNQNYNQKNPAVREVADLIGRSPSAVDRKMANLWAVWRPGRGMAHFSKLDEKIVERYRHQLDQLAREADSIRQSLFDRRPTARAEALGPDEENARIEVLQKLRAAARDDAGNEVGIHVYERPGSWYVGFFIDAYQILTNPGYIPVYLTAAAVAYSPLKKSIARLVNRIHDAAKFAKEVTTRVLPELEQVHFSGGELQQIAKQLARFEVDPIHFNRRLAQAFRRVSVPDLAAEVESFFHIPPPDSCPKCMIILGAAARRALENAGATN